MNEQSSFERLVAEQLANAGVGRPPESAIEDTIARAGRTRRDPRWLALIKEPPMRTNSRATVGSPTVRVVAVMLATLLLAVAVAAAGAAGQRLLAASHTIVVDQAGAGDYTTITEAVAAAADGDTITIMPGRYVESVAVVGKDLHIRGADDRRDEVVIEATSSVPPVAYTEAAEVPFPFAIQLADTATRVTGVTVMGRQDGTAITIVGAGASATLDDIVVRVELPERTEGYVGESVVWMDGASGTLAASEVEGTVGMYRARDVVITSNVMPATCIEASGASGFEIRDNEIHGCIYEVGIRVADGSTGALIEGNDIMVEDVLAPPEFWRSDGRIAIDVQSDGGGLAEIRNNVIHGSRAAIQSGVDAASLVIVGNRLSGNDMGIARVAGTSVVSGNSITGSTQIGLEIRGGAPQVEDNTISENAVGLSIAADAAPALTGNTICGNATNLRVNDGVPMPDIAGNEVCADGA